MQTSKILLVITSLALLCAMCSKQGNTNNQEVSLRDKSLSEAKAIVQGNWKIHFIIGGYNGRQRRPLSGAFFKVVNNDSIYLTFDNQLFAADRAIFQRRQTNTFGWTACMMSFNALGGSAYTWIIDSKIGDTLVLGDDATNPSGYLMTRIP